MTPSTIARRVLIASCALLFSHAGMASLVTWDGGNGTNFAWFSATNWNPNALPTLNDNVQFNLLGVGAIPTLMTLTTGTPLAMQSLTFSPGFNSTNTSLVENGSSSTPSTLRLYGDASSILLDFQPGSGSFTIRNGASAPLNTQIHNSGTINVNPGGTLQILGSLNTSLGGGANPVPVVTKTGAGTFVLGGSTNSFAGSFIINDGPLLVNGSFPTATSVNVNIGGTLGGAGSVNAAAVSVAAGGSIAPGNGVGTLSTGPVTFANTSILKLEIGPATADQLFVTGAASLTGTVALDLTLLGDPVDEMVFTILNASAALSGYAGGARFAYLGNSLDEGEIFTATTGAFSQFFQISYLAGAGSDVTLYAVPEPGALVFLFGGLGLLLGLRRRAS